MDLNTKLINGESSTSGMNLRSRVRPGAASELASEQADARTEQVKHLTPDQHSANAKGPQCHRAFEPAHARGRYCQSRIEQARQ